MSIKRYSVEMNGDDLIIEEAPEGDWAHGEDVEALVEALRDVQLLHSRALIQLPSMVEQRIIELIGPHPRDSVEHLCSGCGCPRERCARYAPPATKCCPDCDHG